MDNLVNKELIIRDAEKLIEKMKEDEGYVNLTDKLQYFIDSSKKEMTDELINKLSEITFNIKKLMELDSEVKERKSMYELFKEISNTFKNQEIREDDIPKIVNGEIFKIVEKIELVNGTEEIDHDLIFITRDGAEKYKKEHKDEYDGDLKIKVIDNKDALLEKILRIIEENY